MSQELIELKKISKILAIINSQALENELGKYATSNDRKKVWVLINGERSPDKLITDSGMKQRALYKYLKLLTDADMIEMQYGQPPKKKLDFVPPTWANLLQTNDEEGS
jgi:hypothetical protein